MSRHDSVLIIALFIILWLLIQPCFSATTQIHIVKYANDKTTILAEKTLTYQEMRDTLPVQGDGATHYYHQGPVFIDDPDEATEQALRWNPDEDTNAVPEKDMGAVMGTDVRDLCDLVGGMAAGDTLIIKASDGLKREFAYSNVYSPSPRQGPMVVTWYCSGSTFSACSGPYPDSGYSDGMRLIFFADDAVNPWGEHVFGNYDWHESADSKYWYYYVSGGEKYPTTTGLSVKYISDLMIYSTKPPGSLSSDGGGSSAPIPVSGSAPPDNPALYGFRGRSLNLFKTGTLNGTVHFFFDPDSEPVVANNRIRDYDIPVNIPEGSNITLARMYLYISKSYNLQTKEGIIPQLYVSLNEQHLEKDRMYFDTDGDDDRHVAATYAYDVRDIVRKNGTYTVSVRNLDHEQFVFTIDGVLLVMALDNETDPSITYWIDEGCDIVSSLPKKGLFPDDCTTHYSFPGTVNMSTTKGAELSLISTGLDNDNTTEHVVKFNDGQWLNLIDTTNSSPVLHLPVRNYLNETGNTADIESTIRSSDADYLVNRNAILIIGSQNSTIPASSGNTSTSGQEQRAPLTDVSDPGVDMEENNNCHVTLESDPEGALVYIDDRYLGKTTPYSLNFIKGDSHTIRFELDGYESSETTLTAVNSTCIHTSLYSPVHSPKGRLKEQPEDPDGTLYGGLYIVSRPGGAMISIDGTSTGKTTPAVIMGLKPGVHTVKLVMELKDVNSRGRNEFKFEDTDFLVLPGTLGRAEMEGFGTIPLYDIIIDSNEFRGIPVTVNGYFFNKSIPAKVSAPQFNSFVTIHDNESYVSYAIPILMNEDRYLQISPRDSEDMSVEVDSDPQGAEVFIDGFRTGLRTPYTFSNISDGTHRIFVTKEGYLPQQKLLFLPCRSVPAPTTFVDFTLEEYPSGFLYVDSSPAGGAVSIDGLDTGEVTPALFKFIPIGTHSVKVTGTNTSKTFQDIVVTSLQITNITADFIPHPEQQYSSVILS